jgi:lysophospholipase L1-like esterase
MFVGRLLAIWLGLACTLMAQPPLTTIQDTVYKADGTRFDGTLTISWKSFTASDSSDVAMESSTSNIVNGALYVQLVPNTNSTPINYYNILYVSDGREQFRELWAVPPSNTPLRVQNVRVTGLLTGSSSGSGGSSGSGSGSGSSGGGSNGGGSAGSVTGGGSTTVTESQVVGLTTDLSVRPVEGPAYAPGRTAVINTSGQIDAVVGNAGDCVHVDGSTGACFDATLLATFVDAETPAGAINGSNTAFTLVNTPMPVSSLGLYRNGVRQALGTDFTLNGNSIQFATVSTPQAGDTLTASYRVGGNGGTPTLQVNTAAPLNGGGSLTSTLTLSLSDAAFLRRGHRTMVIGDQQAGGFYGAGSLPQSWYQWFNQAAVESRSLIQWAGNGGLSANLTSSMVTRLPALLTSAPTDKLFIVAGYSDLNAQVPVASIAANINQMVNIAKAANVLPILCTVPPQPADPTGVDTTITLRVVQLNLQIRNVAKQQGVPLVDFYQVLANPATGLYRIGYSPDGSNPGAVASRLMAARAIAATASLYDQEYPYLPALENDGVNLISDPLFLASPSPWTTGVVSGVAMQNTIGTDPAIMGNTMVLMKTNTSSVNTLTGTAVTSGFNPGDRLAFVGRIKSANCEAGAMQFDVALQFSPGAASTYPIYHWAVDIQDGQWYVEVVAPAGATSMTPVVTLNNGTGSVTLGQVGVINLTQLGF